MAVPPAGQDAAGELQEFTRFLKRMWGVLAGLSTLFPMSNAFAGVLPLGVYPDGAFAFVAPKIVTIISTLVCMFVVLSLFAQRQRFQTRERLAMLRQAWWNFVPGLIALAVYLTGHYAVKADFYFGVFHWESADLRRITGDVLLLAAYVSFFALMTRAFMLLGLLEYLHSRR